MGLTLLALFVGREGVAEAALADWRRAFLGRACRCDGRFELGVGVDGGQRARGPSHVPGTEVSARDGGCGCEAGEGSEGDGGELHGDFSGIINW